MEGTKIATILIADDQAKIRSLVKEKLKKNNYEILEAKDGNETLNIIHNNDVDLLILDVVMENKGGIETLIELNREIKRNLKVIVITGKITENSQKFRDFVSNFGASYILYKPFEKEELVNAVENLLS